MASAGLLSAAVAGPPAGHGNQGNHHSSLKPTHLTVHAPSTVSSSSHFKATVVGYLRSHNTALANESVSVQQRTGKGNDWTATSQSATTDASGKVTFAFVQAATKEQYRLVFACDTTYNKSHSGTITITRVKPAPAPTPTPSVTPSA